ncbi:hypothetical protein ACFQU2_19280 [Siccirubricoccus deserti]
MRAGPLRPPLPPDAVEVADLVILVEILPPATQAIDASAKLAGYFRLPCGIPQSCGRGGDPHPPRPRRRWRPTRIPREGS